MTDAQAAVHRLHAKLDAYLAELLAVDRTGKSVERWCNAQAELHESALAAVRRKQHGTATFVAPVAAGLPSPNKPIEAGFLAKIAG